MLETARLQLFAEIADGFYKHWKNNGIFFL